MNTERKPQKILRCTECGSVYQRSGDVSVRLAHSRPVPMDGTKEAQGKCPLHEDQPKDAE